MKYNEAVDTLGLAIDVLKKRIKNHANKTESVDDSKKDDVFQNQEYCQGQIANGIWIIFVILRRKYFLR